MSKNIFDLAYDCLMEKDVTKKIDKTRTIADRWNNQELSTAEGQNCEFIDDAGRPDQPQLVSAFKLPKRSLVSDEQHLAFVHSLAHIEFNAINLAWDAVYRFRDMPNAFYSDWISVAVEEAYHFSLLNQYLSEHDLTYGDFTAHAGLWDMAKMTAHDVLVRMALVPRVLEARGLDVTPGMIDRLRHHKKSQLVEILEIIYKDEIGHVEIGTRWFRYSCQQRSFEPKKTFMRLVEKYASDKIRPPINSSAREQAGFSVGELEYLNGML